MTCEDMLVFIQVPTFHYAARFHFKSSRLYFGYPEDGNSNLFRTLVPIYKFKQRCVSEDSNCLQHRFESLISCNKLLFSHLSSSVLKDQGMIFVSICLSSIKAKRKQPYPSKCSKQVTQSFHIIVPVMKENEMTLTTTYEYALLYLSSISQ